MKFLYPLIFLAVANHLIVFGFVLLYRSKKVRKIYGIETAKGQIKEELMNSYFTSPLHAILIWGALYTGFFREYPTTWYNFIYTFVIVFVWTEIWHYFSHRLMHHRSLLWIHREHHKSWVTNPISSLSFSFLEKLIFSIGIITPISALSQVLHLSIYGVISYYLFYFVTNVIGHSNIEIRKPGYVNTPIGKILVTPAFHAMHHARYVKNYGLMTSILDRMFNTMWEDYDKVQTRAANDQPLTRLSERLVPKKSVYKPYVREKNPQEL